MSDVFPMAEILTPEFITRAYHKAAPIVERNPFWDFYGTKGAENSDGDIVRMVVRTSTRKPAPTNRRGAPARTLGLQGGTEMAFVPISGFNEIVLKMLSFLYLRDESSTALQKMGQDELFYQIDQFYIRNRLTKVIALAKAFTDGVIYVASNGDILESSSGAENTIDLQVPATHKNQLDGLITIPWSSPTADILGDLDLIKAQAEIEQSPEPVHIWLKTTPWKSHIRANEKILEVAKRVPARAEQILGSYPGDTLDLGAYVFHFTSATYTASDNTSKQLIPADRAVITPDVANGDWLAHFEGLDIIPSGPSAFGSVQEQLANTQLVHGDYAYATLIDNPVRLIVRSGFNFLYAFRNPSAVWMPTIEFETGA